MQAILGAAILALAVLALVNATAARRGKRLFRLPHVTPAARRALMIVAALVAAVAVLPAVVPQLGRGGFAFCEVCSIGPEQAGPSTGGRAGAFLLASWYYAATVLPLFVLACLLSGLVAARGVWRRIRGFWSAFGFAAVLPLCACGAVPLAGAIMGPKRSRAREGLVFLATAPLLSPIILVLAFVLLGPWYAIARIVGAAAVAAAAAWLVRPWITPGSGEARGGRPWEPGDSATGPGRSALAAGFGYLISLLPYALYGIVLGALLSAALPPDLLAVVTRPGLLSLAAAVVIGVPINMCAGEEVVIAAPLVGLGLPLGHALAFGLAGTGICLASLPLLVAVVGRRATAVLVAIYITVPFALGFAADAVGIPS
jgi:uncharacterized membrane protein YraQ (UPF0718 family)